MQDTQVLARVVQRTLADERGDRFELDIARCVAEAVVRRFGVTLWRARLRVIAGRLESRAGDDLAEYGPRHLSLETHVAARALFASIPLTRRWFLRDVPPGARIAVRAADFPAEPEPGSTVTVSAVASIADRTWELPLQVRFAFVEAERMTVAVSGVVTADGSRRRKPAVRVEAAAEFSRCV